MSLYNSINIGEGHKYTIPDYTFTLPNEDVVSQEFNSTIEAIISSYTDNIQQKEAKCAWCGSHLHGLDMGETDNEYLGKVHCSECDNYSHVIGIDKPYLVKLKTSLHLKRYYTPDFKGKHSGCSYDGNTLKSIVKQNTKNSLSSQRIFITIPRTDHWGKSLFLECIEKLKNINKSDWKIFRPMPRLALGEEIFKYSDKTLAEVINLYYLCKKEHPIKVIDGDDVYKLT